MKHPATAAILLLLSFLILSASPRSVRTTRTPLKVNIANLNINDFPASAKTDTITSWSGNVDITGYDKPLSASHETAFVTNRCGRHIDCLAVTLVYTDLSGRQLHKIHRKVFCSVPQGETRQVRWRTWDVNRSFYYRLSRKPRYSGCTPYEVTCTVDTIFSVIPFSH